MDDDEAQRIADAKEYARQALGDAKAAGIEPPPEREHKPNEHVEELRTMLPTATPAPTEERLPAAEGGAG